MQCELGDASERPSRASFSELAKLVRSRSCRTAGGSAAREQRAASIHSCCTARKSSVRARRRFCCDASRSTTVRSLVVNGRRAVPRDVRRREAHPVLVHAGGTHVDAGARDDVQLAGWLSDPVDRCCGVERSDAACREVRGPAERQRVPRLGPRGEDVGGELLPASVAQPVADRVAGDSGGACLPAGERAGLEGGLGWQEHRPRVTDRTRKRRKRSTARAYGPVRRLNSSYWTVGGVVRA